MKPINKIKRFQRLLEGGDETETAVTVGVALYEVFVENFDAQWFHRYAIRSGDRVFHTISVKQRIWEAFNLWRSCPEVRAYHKLTKL